MTLSPEALYSQLGQLVASMPELRGTGPITPEINQWLGRAAALIDASGRRADAISLNVMADSLGTVLREQNAHAIAAIVHRALAYAELAAPAAAQGAFIAAGDTFTAFAAVGKVFMRAKRDLLLVDKYAEASVLTDFAVTAPEGVQIRILTALKEARRAILKPAVVRWEQQFGSVRPITIRMAPGAALHDRLILVDGAEAWITGQSFNHMAEAAHTSISRTDPELAAAKLAAYAELWDAAEPL